MYVLTVVPEGTTPSLTLFLRAVGVGIATGAELSSQALAAARVEVERGRVVAARGERVGGSAFWAHVRLVKRER